MKKLLNIVIISFLVLSIYGKEFVEGINSYREATVYFNRAIRVKDFKKKEELYNQVLEFYKKQDPISYEDILDVYVSMAMDSIEIEDFSNIENILKMIKKDIPHLFEEEKIRLEIHMFLQKERYLKVISMCNELTKLKGDNPYSISFKGVSFMLKADYNNALQMFNHILLKAPEAKLELLYRAMCSTYLSNYKEALKDLNLYIAKTRSLGPKSSLPYYYKAICLYHLGNIDKAKENIAKGREINKVDLVELSNHNDALFKERIEKEVSEIEAKIKEKETA